jgi:sulfide:quinone oxidoreductase
MRVVIGGAGVAALESAAALRRLAAGGVSVTLVAPDRTFRTRALQPFAAFGIDSPRGVPVHALADRLDAQLIEDRVAWVDRDRYTVHCRSGRRIAFEALILGVGATLHVRYPQALALHEGASAGLTQLVSDITSADVRRIAFIAPERMAWPLPLYETALMTAAVGRMHDLRLSLVLVTGEASPLQVFGERASAELRSLLDRHEIELLTARRCQVPAADRVVVLGEHAGETRELAVDRVVALPELIGPHIRGLPSAPHGFIPIDHLCRVPGLGGVYAAGDGTDYPVKHGGIAAQQAEVAARCIAAAAGADVQPHPFHPTLSGMLLTGGTPRYLTARLVGGHPFRSTAAAVPDAAAGAPAKVLAPYLSALLAEIDR